MPGEIFGARPDRPGGGDPLTRANRSASPPRWGWQSSRFAAPSAFAVFSTGDELRAPGTPLADGAIYDSNRFSLMALFEDLGCQVNDLGILPDQPEVVAKTLGNAAIRHDLLISSGGASVGEEDHIRRVIAKLGRIHLWRLAVKPGSSPWRWATLPAFRSWRCPAIRSPPIVTVLLFAKPLIARLSGALHQPPRHYPVIAGFSLKREARSPRIRPRPP